MAAFADGANCSNSQTLYLVASAIETNYPSFQTSSPTASTTTFAYLEAQYHSCFPMLSVFLSDSCTYILGRTCISCFDSLLLCVSFKKVIHGQDEV